MIIVIPFELLSFVILNSSYTLPYPKCEKIGQLSRSYLRVYIKVTTKLDKLPKGIPAKFNPGTLEQARPARPRSGLDFQIHKVQILGFLCMVFLKHLLTYPY